MNLDLAERIDHDMVNFVHRVSVDSGMRRPQSSRDVQACVVW